MSNFIVQALRGENLTVFGDGCQTRSLCYIADLVDGLIALMNCEGTVGPINLGNPDEHTVLELARRVIETVGAQVDVEYDIIPEDDPRRRKPDISKAQKLLNWRPRVSLDEGLQLTAANFRQRAKDKPWLLQDETTRELPKTET